MITVELIESMGNDMSIVNAARVSYNKEDDVAIEWDVFYHDTNANEKVIPYLDKDKVFKEYGLITPRDLGLIDSLIKNKHTSPLEQVEFKFRVNCPISVAREIFRTRIAEYNELSARYTKMPDSFYLPEPEHVRRQTGKAMAYRFKPVAPELAIEFIEALDKMYKECYTFYEHWTEEKKIAKELVRNVLPVGMMTQFIWKLNLHSLFHFLDLRSSDPNSPAGVENESQAMLEIRMVADQMEELVKHIVPAAFISWKSSKEDVYLWKKHSEEFKQWLSEKND